MVKTSRPAEVDVEMVDGRKPWRLTNSASNLVKPFVDPLSYHAPEETKQHGPHSGREDAGVVRARKEPDCRTGDTSRYTPCPPMQAVMNTFRIVVGVAEANGRCSGFAARALVHLRQ